MYCLISYTISFKASYYQKYKKDEMKNIFSRTDFLSKFLEILDINLNALFYFLCTRENEQTGNNHMFNVHYYYLFGVCVLLPFIQLVRKAVVLGFIYKNVCVLNNEIKSLHNCFFTTQLSQTQQNVQNQFFSKRKI